MELPYISIIIPVYQVEAYIEECLKSVAQQTYNGRIECILVDDCGQDRSIDIIQDFIKSYTGSIIFKIINHDHNQGTSAARNTGIRASGGDYLLFIDNDDIISPNCLEILAECVIKDNVDMACGAFKTIEGYHQWWSDIYHLIDFKSTEPKEIIDFFGSGKLYEMPWNKLIKKEVLVKNNIFFKEGSLYEDKMWSFLLINQISSLKTVSIVTYYWRIHNQSQWHDPNQIRKRIDGGIVYQEEMQRLIKEGKIQPTQFTIFRIRREKGRTGGAIIHCKSLSFWKKMSYLYRLLRLPGSHHFIYNLVRHYKTYEKNPL